MHNLCYRHEVYNQFVHTTLINVIELIISEGHHVKKEHAWCTSQNWNNYLFVSRKSPHSVNVIPYVYSIVLLSLWYGNAWVGQMLHNQLGTFLTVFMSPFHWVCMCNERLQRGITMFTYCPSKQWAYSCPRRNIRFCHFE